MTARFTPSLLLALAACAPRQEAAPSAEPQVVVFTAADFSFTGPDSIAPGVTSIRFANGGTQDHHLILGELKDGKTVQDLMAFMQANPNGEPPFLAWRGAAAGISPGDTTGSISDLPAGRYVLICFIPDPADGKPHVTKGMMKELMVAGTPHTAPLPTADGEIHMKDFGYTGPALTAGPHTLRVINDGPQTHEIQLVRLNEGVTAQQYLAALAPGATAPPPGVLIGGPGALSTGLDTYWTVSFTPGHYLFVCFVPDVADGVPHLMKGMVHEFSIPAT